jgi:hypothetical protein
MSTVALCVQPLINVKGFGNSRTNGGRKRLERKAKQRRKAAGKAAGVGAAEEESVGTAEGDAHHLQ